MYETRGEAEHRAGRDHRLRRLLRLDEAAGGVSGEAWAKACALALLDQARAARRDFAGILFSSASELADVPVPRRPAPAIGDVLDFAESFFGGGTDFAAPLDAAAESAGGRVRHRRPDARRHRVHHRRGMRRHRGLDAVLAGAQGPARLSASSAWPSAAEPGPVLDRAVRQPPRTVTDLAEPGAAADMFRVI